MVTGTHTIPLQLNLQIQIFHGKIFGKDILKMEEMESTRHGRCYQEDSIPDIKNRLKKMDLDNRFNTNDGICPNAGIGSKTVDAIYN